MVSKDDIVDILCILWHRPGDGNLYSPLVLPASDFVSCALVPIISTPVVGHPQAAGAQYGG